MESTRGLEVRARDGSLEPLGVIDIGSNSVRLVVYEGAVRAPTPLFNEKVLCGLGRSVASTGRLGEESVARALAALRRFRAIAHVLDVKHLRVVATAAVRDAADGKDFIARGEEACGWPIHVLSGEHEAELAAKGILMGFGEADGVAGDLGGGSLELIDISGSRLRQAATLPLGGLRLLDLTGSRMDDALAFADEQITRFGWLAENRGRSFYAVGGTWRALARLHMDDTDYPLRVMQGYTVSTRDTIAFCEELRAGGRVKGFDGIARARREVLPFGALVMERLLRRLEPDKVVFSVFGIREGLLFSLLSEHERRKDPLLSFCDDYARLRSRSARHARELCAWTDAIFAEPGPKETAEERRLRHAACLISDVGWRAHPDYRGEQSLNVIAHAALAGIDHPGRLFLAMSIYFRHVGGGDAAPDEFSSRIRRLMDKRALHRARVLGAALRTAHMLSIGMPGIIDETPLCYDAGRLVLSIPPVYAALDGERLRRRFEALAGLLDLPGEVRVAT
ncbi:MAG: Ppx/GppA family phosphatase [Hyphomicrobiaceae bacterium]|nr:Ppx/GppA family phosphatase [Hyphomicrobiaceae bacterium]